MPSLRFTDISAWTRAHKIMVALIALVMLVAGGASASAAYRAPTKQQHAAEHERWAEDAAYTYSVPVTRNSTHWPIGTVLPMGMPAYFRTISEQVPFVFTWNATGALGNASGITTLWVRAQAHDGRLYWAIQHDLAMSETNDVGAGLRMQGAVDLDEIVAEIAQAYREMPMGDGTLNVTLETNVSYSVEAAGGPDAARETFVFPLNIQDPRILLPMPSELQWHKPHVAKTTWVTEAPAGWDGALTDLTGLALLVAGGLVLAMLAYASLLDPLARLSPRDASYVREHQRHRAWVTTSTGELDVGGFPGSVVEVASLEALVEAASDARCRVLHDPMLRVYYAVLPNATYRYARHAKVA